MAFLGLTVINKNSCSRTLQLSFKNCKTNLIMLQIIYDSMLGHIHSYPGWQGPGGSGGHTCWGAAPWPVILLSSAVPILTSSHLEFCRACPWEPSCPGVAGISYEACQRGLLLDHLSPCKRPRGGAQPPPTCELGKSLRTLFPQFTKK